MIDTPTAEEIARLPQAQTGTVLCEDAHHVHGDAYDECIAACPVCITYSCTLNQGHYSKHRCQEGHEWL